MKYLTGIHALNLECPLPTGGDWHTSALRWKDITIADTDEMFFGDYGITIGVPIPKHYGPYAVADHIRALLDLLQWGDYAEAQGMNNDFICNSDYDLEVLQKVWAMRVLPNWGQIDAFMGKEYLMKWVWFKEHKKGGCHMKEWRKEEGPDWRPGHRAVIEDFLGYLNRQTDQYILKEGDCTDGMLRPGQVL